jgi:hypothetical protein
MSRREVTLFCVLKILNKSKIGEVRKLKQFASLEIQLLQICAISSPL